MGRKRHTPEQIIRKLREVDVVFPASFDHWSLPDPPDTQMSWAGPSSKEQTLLPGMMRRP